MGAGTLGVGASGKTTFPNNFLQSVTMVSAIKHTEKSEDVFFVVGFVGCETKIDKSSFLIVPRLTITDWLHKNKFTLTANTYKRLKSKNRTVS